VSDLNQNKKVHIILSFTAIVLAVCILAPTLDKLSHYFSDHSHELCENASVTHFHQVEFDCDFYKYKISHPLVIGGFSIDLIKYEKTFQEPINLNSLIITRDLIYFSLRGPPSTLS